MAKIKFAREELSFVKFENIHAGQFFVLKEDTDPEIDIRWAIVLHQKIDENTYVAYKDFTDIVVRSKPDFDRANAFTQELFVVDVELSVKLPR